MDYPVPNLGQDRDIADSLNHERLASKMTGHNWAFKTDESWEKYRNKAKDTLYNFHMSLDGDIQDSVSHLNAAEGEYGTWDIPQKVKAEPQPL